MNSNMKYKKVVIAAVIIVLLFAIVFVSSYYKFVTDDDELASKRNAILEYLKENKGTNLSKGFNQDIVNSHWNAFISMFQEVSILIIHNQVIQDWDSIKREMTHPRLVWSYVH